MTDKKYSSHYSGSLDTSGSRLVHGLDDDVDSDSNWLISLSDILSLLLVFFIMFLVMTKGSGAGEKADPVRDREQTLPAAAEKDMVEPFPINAWDEIATRVSSLDFSDNVSVLETKRELIVTIREKVTFSPGEAEILHGFEPVLDSIAEVITKHRNLNVEIIGHTDNVPIRTSRYQSNWELSISRAASVLRYFIQNHSIDSSRLSIRGNADLKPTAPNDTPEHRAQNRRVEIKLRRPEA